MLVRLALIAQVSFGNNKELVAADVAEAGSATEKARLRPDIGGNGRFYVTFDLFPRLY